MTGPRVIISGAVANKPLNGGESWVRLSWLRGFERLGCQVYLLEQIRPEHCVDAGGARTRFEDSVNLAYFRWVVDTFGLQGRAALVCDDESATSGATLAELDAVSEAADLLVNITGHLRMDRFLRRIRRKVYVDIDPGFTQYWHAAGIAGAHLEGHDAFFTIGEHIGTPACQIPTSGIPWRPIRQPVTLDDWPVISADFDSFTTISSWRGTYGRLEVDGKAFGTKAHEFRKFLDLPALAAAPFEIALDIHPGDARDIDALNTHGWTLVDPRTVASDPFAFREYVQHSGAEFSVAQGVYVETNSGWFSDRTVRYLASGRPALVQDTGFSDLYPATEGLVAFRTLDEAVAGARRIIADYPAHAQAARRIAEEHFDSGKVLRHLLDQMGVQL